MDLDGTLIRSDTLWESVFFVLRKNPFKAMAMLAWVTRGRRYFKDRMSDAAPMDPALMPYHTAFLEYLRSERQRGRTIVLATGSSIKAARRIAQHLDIFSAIHASDMTTNLKGLAKADRLCAVYGPGNFTYAGDSRADVPVWRAAGSAILVNTQGALRKQVGARVTIEREFPPERTELSALVAGLRLHQWVKNLLLAVPLLTAHLYGDASAVAAVALGVLAMCLVSSATYLFNDLLDLEADRRHPEKRKRPIASGILSIPLAAAAALILLALGILLAATLPLPFLYALLGYIALTGGYSLYLKHLAWIDVAVLAALYTLRVYMGGLAIDVPVSNWLLAYAAVVFFSLALLKRSSELRDLISQDRTERARAYHVGQSRTVERIGIAAAILSAAILVAYVNSETVA
ncbi:MAG: UbiA family prenyltransferase, partial [Burkholderiales bacterium]|nr:UbiA family prenyltransferase [Burkholderiales bacterium]